ncbi:MAG TPA: sugar phosphate isomerase/epimerase [Armatimonadota bacterium]
MSIRITLVALAAVGLAAASSGAAPALPKGVAKPHLNYAAMNKLGWKLSCQAYTFRDMTLFETIDTLQAIGIRYIELYPGQRFSPDNPASFDHNASPEMIAQLQRKLKAARITAVNYGVVGLDDNEAGDSKVFDFARKMKLITIVSEPPESAMPMLDRLCKEYKINVAIHDHPTPSHYAVPETVLAATKGLSKRVGSCADTGHWYRSGRVPVECLRQLKGRIISLHFKDLDAEKRDAPWGTGVLDASKMLEELKRQKFRGVFSIEYESTTGAELVSNVAKCCQFFSDEAVRLTK